MVTGAINLESINTPSRFRERVKQLSLSVLAILATILSSSGSVFSQQNIVYAYDSLSRLVEVRYPDKVIHYTYDAAGNRTSMTVEALNPVPTTSSLNVTTGVFGSPGFTITVNGTSFINTSTVQWNATDRATTFVSDTQLTATILATDLNAAGTAIITVVSPGPGGGASNPQTFTINKGTPVITWGNPADIVFGTHLSNTQLNATASFNGAPVPGSFNYTPALDTVLNAGANQTLSTVFTPTDTANLSPVTANVHVNVVKATPSITWNNPTDIVFGTLLSNTQLNAVATVNGSSVVGAYNYTPSVGTQLNAGDNQLLSVTFVPADTANINNANG